MSIGKQNWSYRIVILSLIGNVCFFSCVQQQIAATIGDTHLLQEIECLAVIPLANETDNSHASKIFADLLENELVASRYFQVMESDEVARAFSFLNVALEPSSELELIRKVGQLLHVQGLLLGTAKKYHYRALEGDSEEIPIVALELRLHHIPTGTVLWTAFVEQKKAAWAHRNRSPLSEAAIKAVQQAVQNLITLRTINKPITTATRCGSWFDPTNR